MGDFNGANVCDLSGRTRQHYPPPLLPFIPIIMDIGVRANIHWGGGANRFLPEWIPTVGGGGRSSRNFPGSIICGGEGSRRHFRGPCAPDSVGGEWQHFFC